MSKLTFTTFWIWFVDYSKEIRTESEIDVLHELFDVYFRGDVNLLSAEMINKIKKTKEKLPKKLIATYCPGRKHFYELKQSVKKNLLAYIPDWCTAAQNLNLTIQNDSTISRPEWDDILNGYPVSGEDEIAIWLTNVLFCALTPKGHPETAKGLQPVSLNYCPPPCKWFVGREDELGVLDEKIRTDRKVFLHGIPGIGKSELAKKYIRYAREKDNFYQEVLWIPCRGSLLQSIACLDLLRDLPSESQDTRYGNHFHFLKHITERGLVVLDNCNWLPEEETLLDEIMKCKCHVLVTTRTYVEDRINMEVKEMKQSELLELMRYFYKKKEAFPEQTMKRLIEKLHRHTYAVELVARLTAKDLPSPKELLMKLMFQCFVRSVKKGIRNQKDNTSQKASYYQTMSELFSLLKLDESKQEVMRNMTLMPDGGIYHDCFVTLLGMEDDAPIEDLEQMGLLRWDEEECVVQMLPMVRDITLEDIPPSIQACDELVENITQQYKTFGVDNAQWQLLYEIVKQIIVDAEKDDLEKYWELLCNTFYCVEQMQEKPAMLQIFAEIEKIQAMLSQYVCRQAEYLDIKACLEKDWDKIVELEELALNMLEESGQGDSELARNICSNLAGAYRKSYKYAQAVELFERRLRQITTEESSLQRYNYLTCVCGLAVTYAEAGEREKAMELLLPVEQQFRDIQIDSGYEYGMVLETLGHVYAITGQICEAEKIYKKAIATWTNLYGDRSGVVLEKGKEYTQLIYPQRNMGTVEWIEG